MASWGSCPPAREVAPAYARTLVEECADVNARGGLELLPWQRSVLAPWLALTPGGKWACTTAGNEVPRQNGKTVGVTCARAQYGMLKRWPVLGGRGERVIYTAHLQKTATETFEYMADFFTSTPALRKRLKDVKSALGREQITLKNGGRVKFLARTRNGGRGQHGDLLIFDEALELSAGVKASFLPVVSASPNPQVVYTSTPPTPGSDSAAYTAIRDNALSGRTTRACWHEWGVDAVPRRDASADELLALARMTNPSMGVLISEDNVRAEIEQMDDPLSFAIERLGFWAPPAKADDDRAVPPDAWARCATSAPAPDAEPAAYGVKFSPDGAEVCVAVCVPGERPRVELAADASTGRGTRWLRAAMEAHAGAAWLVDGKSGAQALVDSACCPARVATAADAASAAGGFLDALREMAVEVYSPGGDRLGESARLAVRRRIGTSGGWGFGGDSAPLEAAALAWHAARTTGTADEMEVYF